MNNSFFKSFLLLSFSTIFISCFSIFTTDIDKITPVENVVKLVQITTKSDDFLWPIPGYKRISSGFGKRIAPTTGASTNHSGIDIPAPPGTNLVAISDGIVTNTHWRWSWWFHSFYKFWRD